MENTFIYSVAVTSETNLTSTAAWKLPMYSPQAIAIYLTPKILASFATTKLTLYTLYICAHDFNSG